MNSQLNKNISIYQSTIHTFAPVLHFHVIYRSAIKRKDTAVQTMELLVCARHLGIGAACYFLYLVHPPFFMSTADWIVLVSTLLLIVVYGLYKSRTTRDLEGIF
jgi:hypothetical protein